VNKDARKQMVCDFIHVHNGNNAHLSNQAPAFPRLDVTNYTDVGILSANKAKWLKVKRCSVVDKMWEAAPDI